MINKPFIALMLATLFSCSGNSNSGESTTGTVETVKSYEQKLITAFLENDIAVIKELYHDDFLFNNPQGETLTKAMDIDNLKSGVMKVLEYSASDQQVNLIDDTAVVAVTIHLKATIGGNLITGDYRFLRIWKLIDSKWKVIGMSGVTTSN